LRSQTLSTPSKLSRVWKPVGCEPIRARYNIKKKELEEEEEEEEEGVAS
jgi:hypothetical protein